MFGMPLPSQIRLADTNPKKAGYPEIFVSDTGS